MSDDYSCHVCALFSEIRSEAPESRGEYLFILGYAVGLVDTAVGCHVSRVGGMCPRHKAFAERTLAGAIQSAADGPNEALEIAKRISPEIDVTVIRESDTRH